MENGSSSPTSSNTIELPDAPSDSIHHHPTLNGMFRHSRITNDLTDSTSARPCDKNGKFLQDDELPSSEPLDTTDWTPFTSRGQFETGEFLFKRVKMSAGNIDELLTLWATGASASGDELPFVNHVDLYNTIDNIPVGGVPWQNLSVSYTGLWPEADVPPWMEQSYEVYFRDPRQLFQNMLANPSFAEDFDYTPMRIFDINGGRRYENFMSGDWAWKQAVGLLWLLHLFY